jgi:CTP synthase (UTP-ammonia lyase)
MSLVITPLACSLVGQEHPVAIVPGTRAATLYGVEEAIEAYYCNYGINPEYRGLLEAGGLVVSGVGGQDEVRIVELPDHPFFVAALFLPQARSTAESPHPLIIGFAAAVAAHRTARRPERRAAHSS